MTRTCAYKHCDVEFEPKRPHHRFHDEKCRYGDWLEKQENSGEQSAQRVGDGSGSRGGNVRDLDTARDLQGQVKDKRDWSGAIDEQIRIKLVGTATVHANDLDGIGVPPEHRNLIGTRMARYCNKGWMEPTTERRKVEHPAANGRKNPVYRITPKGWRELTAGVEGGSAGTSSPSVSAAGHSLHPGGARPTGAPTSKESGRATNPPVPSASDQSSPVAASTSQPAAGENLSLLPEPDPEAWAA